VDTDLFGETELTNTSGLADHACDRWVWQTSSRFHLVEQGHPASFLSLSKWSESGSQQLMQQLRAPVL
jgi:hypothetical protein